MSSRRGWYAPSRTGAKQSRTGGGRCSMLHHPSVSPKLRTKERAYTSMATIQSTPSISLFTDSNLPNHTFMSISSHLGCQLQSRGPLGTAGGGFVTSIAILRSSAEMSSACIVCKCKYCSPSETGYSVSSGGGGDARRGAGLHSDSRSCPSPHPTSMT